MSESDFQVKLRKTVLLDPGPKPRQMLTIRGETFAIRGLTDWPTSPLLILHIARA
jgi:hypothetical protein